MLAVSLRVFGDKVFDRISAPIARRLRVGRAPRGRDGGLLAVSTLAWKFEVEVVFEVFDRISASIEGRFCAARAPADRLVEEGPLWRRFGDWGL